MTLPGCTCDPKPEFDDVHLKSCALMPGIRTYERGFVAGLKRAAEIVRYVQRSRICFDPSCCDPLDGEDFASEILQEAEAQKGKEE